MNASKEIPASKWVIYAGILWFSAMGLPALFISINSFIDLLVNIHSQSEIIRIHKGLFYGFGGGIALLIFVAIGIYTKILNKKLSSTLNKLLVRLLVASIIVMLVLPHVIYYVTADYLENENYQMCEPDRIQWPIFRTIVYTKSLSCD